MKKKSTKSSLFKILGITPQTIIILIIGISFAGILLGLLVKNSNKKQPVPVFSINEEKEIQEVKELPQTFDDSNEEIIQKFSFIDNTLFNENKLSFL